VRNVNGAGILRWNNNAYNGQGVAPDYIWPDKVADEVKSEPMQGARSPSSEKGGKQDAVTRAAFELVSLSARLLSWKNP